MGSAFAFPPPGVDLWHLLGSGPSCPHRSDWGALGLYRGAWEGGRKVSLPKVDLFIPLATGIECVRILTQETSDDI